LEIVRPLLVYFSNFRHVIAAELLIACQAADIRGADLLSPATRALYDMVRKVVPYLAEDVALTDYTEEVAALLKNVATHEAIEKTEAVTR
jgi:histidine ammonia-lyase